MSRPCEHCPDGHRETWACRPMSVVVGPERDEDGQPTTLHVSYSALHHVSEHEARWLRAVLHAASVGDLTTRDLIAQAQEHEAPTLRAEEPTDG